MKRRTRTAHPVARAARIAGSLQALAVQLGVTKGAVWQWMLPHRQVPVQRALAIEQLTGGAVTRRELRPTDWYLVWPELAVASREAA